ncbi:hypothetical protein TrVGV298_001717 [Trichoderma virens]|nr:hypothetical protein TrVGV298_001717 [Trichoderma virens]
MGFRFGKSDARVETEAVSSGVDVLPGAGNVESELRNFRKQHRWDPFLDIDKLDNIDEALASGNAEKEAAIDESLIQEDSPYPEVRASVPPTDIEVPVDTIRAWTIGAVMCTIVAACNILLTLRRAPITITSTVVQLVSYPIGCFWARVMPNWTFTLFGHTFELNPGPFNVKEHTIITMMTAAGTAASYAIDILLAQEIFYEQHLGWGFQILLILSTQAMGFGVAGVARRYLVWPSSMVWPAVLITTTVMYSLHDHSPADPAMTNGWKIGRYSFFLLVAAGTFCWEWIPQVIAQFLQLFMFPCWIAPNNVVVNQIFGGNTGLGLLPISFDWSIISGFLLSPLQTPAFAIANVSAGIFVMLLGIIGLAYAGPEFYRYLPLSANQNFDHYAQPYNTSRILNPDFTVNLTAYREYSPYPVGTCLLPVVRIFLVSFGLGMAASLAWPTHLPAWAFIICILIGLFFFIPVGMVQAITNQQTGLNIITEMIFGYMLPGRPVAMMLFKSWGYMMTYNGLTYVSDMKVGHYMKIPPRSMFGAQAFAVIWLSIVQIAAYNFLRGNIEGICTPTQAQGLTCPNARTFYNASVIWGVIGPKLVFGAGQLYSWINWFWLIGFACPLIQWIIARRYPRSMVRYIVFPALFGAAGMIPPATTWYLAQWCIVGLIFNWWIRRRWLGWWTQYNYVLSGALDIGTALCTVIIGLGLGLGNASFPDWWGNTVINNNLDANGAAILRVAPTSGPGIGPTKCSFEALEKANTKADGDEKNSSFDAITSKSSLSTSTPRISHP